MGEIKLGARARDVITGFEGIVMAKANYLTGREEVLLIPEGLNSEAKPGEGQWFEGARIDGALKKNSAGFCLEQRKAKAEKMFGRLEVTRSGIVGK